MQKKDAIVILLIHLKKNDLLLLQSMIRKTLISLTSGQTPLFEFMFKENELSILQIESSNGRKYLHKKEY